jgi:hypothetical protein
MELPFVEQLAIVLPSDQLSLEVEAFTADRFHVIAIGKNDQIVILGVHKAGVINVAAGVRLAPA